MAILCHGYDVNDIFVWGMNCRRSKFLDKKVNRINFLLKLKTKLSQNFVYLSNAFYRLREIEIRVSAILTVRNNSRQFASTIRVSAILTVVYFWIKDYTKIVVGTKSKSLEVSIVVWSHYITLKLFWRTLENDVIKGLLFHIFHQAFYKYFLILVFWNKYSPFAPIFIMLNSKRGPI